MLPDLPKLKWELSAIFVGYVDRKSRELLGVFNESPRHTVHEGNRMKIIRADGSAEDSGFKKAEGVLSMKSDDLLHMTGGDRLEQLNHLAMQMATQMSSHLFESLNETLDEAGQAVDAHGKVMDGEMILSVLERMDLEFDEATGLQKPLAIVVPPGVTDKVRAVFHQLRSDPVLGPKYLEMLNKKWMDWRDREASRRLVG